MYPNSMNYIKSFFFFTARKYLMLVKKRKHYQNHWLWPCPQIWTNAKIASSFWNSRICSTRSSCFRANRIPYGHVGGWCNMLCSVSWCFMTFILCWYRLKCNINCDWHHNDSKLKSFFSLSGLSPFMGDTDLETMANVTIAEYDYEDEAFDKVSDLAKDFIDKLLIKEKE